MVTGNIKSSTSSCSNDKKIKFGSLAEKKVAAKITPEKKVAAKLTQNKPAVVE